MQKKTCLLSTKISKAIRIKQRCLKINNYYKKHGNLNKIKLTAQEIEMINSAEIINIEGIPFPSWVLKNIDRRIKSMKNKLHIQEA